MSDVDRVQVWRDGSYLWFFFCYCYSSCNVGSRLFFFPGCQGCTSPIKSLKRDRSLTNTCTTTHTRAGNKSEEKLCAWIGREKMKTKMCCLVFPRYSKVNVSVDDRKGRPLENRSSRRLRSPFRPRVAFIFSTRLPPAPLPQLSWACVCTGLGLVSCEFRAWVRSFYCRRAARTGIGRSLRRRSSYHFAWPWKEMHS